MVRGPTNHVFVEYSTGVEISTVKNSEKKLEIFFDMPYKYLGLTLITYGDIQKGVVTFFFFFGLTVGSSNPSVAQAFVA